MVRALPLNGRRLQLGSLPQANRFCCRTAKQSAHLREQDSSSLQLKRALLEFKAMRHIDFPFSFDSSGNTATTKWRDHKRDMLVQFLLTLPGERVNRPDFGTPLSRMCFEGNSQGLAEVNQFIA